MRKLFLCLASVVLFLSTACNPDELTITIKQTGNVRVAVVDQNNAGISDAKITISDYGSLLEEKTDESGIFISQNLLQGTYECTASVMVDKVEYTDYKYIQIIADEQTKVELTPFANVGTFSIGLWNRYDDSVISGAGVALLKDYDYSWNVEQLLEEAWFAGKTASYGWISFKDVPVGHYYVVIYEENDNWWSVYDSGYVRKGEVLENPIWLYYPY